MSEGNLNQLLKSKETLPKPKKRSTWLLWVVLIIVIAVGVGIWFLLVREKPSVENPASENFGEEVNLTDKGKDLNEFNWSQMEQGPYHDRVSFATGATLTDWTDSEKILAEHASVPDVLVKDATLYVYFVDVSQNGKPEQIGLLRSVDYGQTWEEKVFATIQGLGDKVAVDPAPMLLEDGRIRLYYFDIGSTKTQGTENNTIYSAISSDGINFTQETGFRFRKADIFDPDVVKIGDTWRMYVGTGNQQVLTAISQDGLTFTYEGVALNGGAIPNVVYENGTYYLFTGGIEISTSSDGETFTETGKRFDSGGPTNDPGVAKLSDGTYFMVYKTDDGTKKPQNNPPVN